MESFAVLDIGSHQTVALAGQAVDMDRIQITGASRIPSIGLIHECVGDPAAARAVIEAALHEVERQSGQKIDEVYLSVPGSRYQSLLELFNCSIDKTVRRADVDGLYKQMQATPLPENHVMLHTIPAGFNLDGHFFNLWPYGAFGDRLRMLGHMVCIEENAIKNLRLLVSASGRKVRRMYLQSIAATRAVRTEDDKEKGVCIVHLGASTIDVVVYSHEQLSDSFCLYATGGTLLTQDLARLLRIPTAEAERIKCEYGCALRYQAVPGTRIPMTTVGGGGARATDQQQVSMIIEARMEEVFTHLREELKSQNHFDRLAAGVILTGGGSELKGIAALAEEVLGLPVRIGLPALAEGTSIHRADCAVAVGVLQLANQVSTPPVLLDM